MGGGLGPGSRVQLWGLQDWTQWAILRGKLWVRKMARKKALKMVWRRIAGKGLQWAQQRVLQQGSG